MNIQIYVGVIFRLFVWVLFLQYRCGFVCRLVSSWRLRPKMLQRLLRVQLEPINEAEAWPKFTMMQYNNSIVFSYFLLKFFLFLISCVFSHLADEEFVLLSIIWIKRKYYLPLYGYLSLFMQSEYGINFIWHSQKKIQFCQIFFSIPTLSKNWKG